MQMTVEDHSNLSSANSNPEVSSHLQHATNNHAIVYQNGAIINETIVLLTHWGLAKHMYI